MAQHVRHDPVGQACALDRRLEFVAMSLETAEEELMQTVIAHPTSPKLKTRVHPAFGRADPHLTRFRDSIISSFTHRPIDPVLAVGEG